MQGDDEIELAEALKELDEDDGSEHPTTHPGAIRGALETAATGSGVVSTGLAAAIGASATGASATVAFATTSSVRDARNLANRPSTLARASARDGYTAG